MKSKRFTQCELEEHYESDRFYTIEVYGHSGEYMTYLEVMDTDDGKHYAIQYDVPHKSGKIRFRTDEYPEVFPTPILDLRMGYSVEENHVEVNITPENLTVEQAAIYQQLLNDAAGRINIKRGSRV